MLLPPPAIAQSTEPAGLAAPGARWCSGSAEQQFLEASPQIGLAQLPLIRVVAAEALGREQALSEVSIDSSLTNWDNQVVVGHAGD